MGKNAQMLGADMMRHASKESQADAFEILLAYAKRLETTEPEDGKNAKYYQDRFYNAELMGHRAWFGWELAKYCEKMEAESGRG